MGRRVAYLGPEGSFSEEAARLQCGPEAELVGFPDLPAVFAALELGTVDQAMAPIENSIEGSVNQTLDHLVHALTPPRIVAELNLLVRHHLVVRPGTTLTDIERLVAHPQAVAQCRTFVTRQLPHLQVLPALSNSAAVQGLVMTDRSAAIGNERSADLYGMEILVGDIQDSAENRTRFVLLGHDGPPPTGRDKTAICCSTAEDRPGSLLAVLAEFAQRSINLTKIESRPTREALGRYYFLIDLEGHEREPAVAAAIAGARAVSHELRVFGSFPAG